MGNYANTALRIQFTPFMEGWAALGLLLFIVYPSYTSFTIMLVLFFLFAVLRVRNMPAAMMLRWLLRGSVRPAKRYRLIKHRTKL